MFTPCAKTATRLSEDRCKQVADTCSPCKGYDLRNYLNHFGFDTFRATHHHEWFYMKEELMAVQRGARPPHTPRDHTRCPPDDNLRWGWGGARRCTQCHHEGAVERARALIESRLATRLVTRESSSLRGSFFDDSLGTSLITSLSFFPGSTYGPSPYADALRSPATTPRRESPLDPTPSRPLTRPGHPRSLQGCCSRSTTCRTRTRSAAARCCRPVPTRTG